MASKIKRALYPLCLAHWLFYKFSTPEQRALIDSDIQEMNKRCKSNGKGLIFWLVYRQPYRNLFYVRIPHSRFLKFIMPEYPFFTIECSEGIGKNAFVLNHPYGTILNAKKIGDNFTCCHLTTIGNARHGRNDLVPVIGNNVSIGANVTIIGNLTIGNNVTIGAGSVVVKNVPDNCVVAGNPSRIIKTIVNDD